MAEISINPEVVVHPPPQITPEIQGLAPTALTENAAGDVGVTVPVIEQVQEAASISSPEAAGVKEDASDSVVVDSSSVDSVTPSIEGQEELSADREAGILSSSLDIIEDAKLGGVFDTPEKIGIAEAALADPNNASAVLEALRMADEHTRDAPESNAEVKTNIAGLGQFVDADKTGVKSFKHEVEAIVAKDERTTPSLTEDMEQDGLTVRQVVDKAVDGQISLLENASREGLSEEKIEENEMMLYALKASKKYKGEEGIIIAMGALRFARSGMQPETEESLALDKVIARGNKAEQDAYLNIKSYLKRNKGLGDEQINSIFESAVTGSVGDLSTTFSRLMDKDLGKKLIGKDFKTDQEAIQFYNDLITNPTKSRAIKKRAGKFGIFAALLLIGAGNIAH